jgi:hypothetical protein
MMENSGNVRQPTPAMSSGYGFRNSFLRERSDALPQAGAILLVAADRKLVNSSGLWPVQAFELSDRDYLRRLQLDSGPGVFISAPAIDGSSGLGLFFLAHRVSGAGGELIGLVLSAIDIRYLEDFFLAVSPHNSTSVTVFRRDGTMLARYPHIEAMVGGKLPAASPFYSRVEEGSGSYNAPGYRDESARIVSVHPLHDVRSSQQSRWRKRQSSPTGGANRCS